MERVKNSARAGPDGDENGVWAVGERRESGRSHVRMARGGYIASVKSAHGGGGDSSHVNAVWRRALSKPLRNVL